MRERIEYERIREVLELVAKATPSGPGGRVWIYQPPDESRLRRLFHRLRLFRTVRNTGPPRNH